MERAQPLELARLQRHRRVVAQPRPLLAREDRGREYIAAPVPEYPWRRLLAIGSYQLALARRLLFQSRHCRALRQRGLDIFQRHAARLQQHEQMIEQIGALGDQMIAIVLDRGDHGFDRLLAEFLGAVLAPLSSSLRV